MTNQKVRSYNSLPKWAQEEINQLKSNQSTKHVGAEIIGCHVENIAVKHSTETASAITSIANALKSNADALSVLAGSIQGKGVTLNVDSPAFNLQNIRAKD